MNSKLWIQKALTMCLLTALVATYSMVTLANTGKAIGELTVTGGNSAGETSFVTVNGEPAKSGRSVFTSSTITTPEGMIATVNFGKAGKIQLGSNSSFILNSNDSIISGDLNSGSITVLSAVQSVNVRTLSGEVVQLNAGETAFATAGKAKATRDHRDSNGKCIDDDGDGDADCDEGAGWWIWALIFGGATVGAILAATASNDNNLGGGTTVVSPVR